MADEWLAEECIIAAAAAEEEPVRMIDCVRGTKRPVIRHIVAQELDRGWILTECGARVISYFNADSTMHYTDGSVYARYCKRCFPSTREAKDGR